MIDLGGLVVYGSGVLKLALLKTLDATRPLPLRVRYLLAEVCFAVMFALLRAKRRAVYRNLSLVLDRRPTRREVLSVFLDYGRYWAESADIESFWQRRPRCFVGDPLPTAGEQFIGLTLHIGNFELFGPALYEIRGTSFAVVAEALRPAFLTRYFAAKRGRYHIHTLPHDRPREILGALRKGDSLGIVCDRTVGGEGEPVRMLGATFTLPLSVVNYALEHGIAIVISYCVRDDNGIAVISRRLPATVGFDQALAHIAASFEQALRAYPSQWHALVPVV